MPEKKKKLIRITTIPQSLAILLKGQPKFMSRFYEVLCISSHGNGVLDALAEYEGTRAIPVEMTRNITPLKDLRSTWELYRIFRNEKPFIVHTHSPKAGAVGMLAAYLARVPNRLHTNGGLAFIEIRGMKRFMLDLVEKFTYACASTVYTNSFGLKDILVKKKYAKESKIRVLGNGSSNGIDTVHFSPNAVTDSDKEDLRGQLGISKYDYVFIFVGRLVMDKGINELIEAFKEIADKNDKVKLLLVGPFEKSEDNQIKPSDELQPETIDFIRSSDQVMAVGFQTDVRPYFAISDCLVFPSYREGFPNVVMQAGAMGLPTIATDINGCNEIIVPNKNGALVPPKKVPELEESMKAYLNKGRGNEEGSAAIRKIIEDRFSQQIIWELILKEYKRLEDI